MALLVSKQKKVPARRGLIQRKGGIVCGVWSVGECFRVSLSDHVTLEKSYIY